LGGARSRQPPRPRAERDFCLAQRTDPIVGAPLNRAGSVRTFFLDPGRTDGLQTSAPGGADGDAAGTAMTRVLIENPSSSRQAITVTEIFDGFSVHHNLRPGENASVALGRCQSVVIRGLDSAVSASTIAAA